jgi:hypothetical protein
VRVPPFIAVRLVVRSADGRRYRIRVPGGAVDVRDGGTASLNLEGLRPGERYVGRVRPSGQVVRIEASAEPGP